MNLLERKEHGTFIGTDGVRGVANKELTCETAFKLGQAAVAFQGKTILIGKDTRLSGDMLESAVASGIMSMGGTALLAGIIPTPAIALLVRELHCDGGIVISASHNPMPDNGIKFFAHGGYKLPDAVEDEIEALLGTEWDRPTGDGVGEVDAQHEKAKRLYVNHLVKSVNTDLKGLTIVVDCANGAAFELGPLALREAGAEVIVINAEPDGRNINLNAGSTHPEGLQKAVVEHKADFGVAYDGDADRCLAVDAEGNLIDGDKIMGALAEDARERGKLKGDTLCRDRDVEPRSDSRDA